MLDYFQFESKSPFLPPFIIPVYKSFFVEGGFKGVDKLNHLVLEKEKEILETTKPYPLNDTADWLTNRLYEYTLFSYANEYPVLNDLKQHISKCYLEYCDSLNIQPSKVYITCWANVIRKGNRHITPHHHCDGHIKAPFEYAYVSGNICVSANGTSTYYRNHLNKNQSARIINIPGEMYLFPSWVEHWTDANESEEPRVSIAFDIITEEVYNMFPETNKHFIEL
jgi:hypothetical protein